MPSTVIGLYPTEADVERVMDDLASHDFPRRTIARRDASDADLRTWLEDQGVPDREADEYLGGVRDGGKLVTLEVSDDRAAEAIEIMRRHEQGSGYAGAGTAVGEGTYETGGDAYATGAGATGDVRGDRGARTRVDGEEKLEVTEEELEVGKRQVDRGGVRVRTYVTERPVEEQVRVRDETVNVERRPVDRTVDAADADRAFQEKTVEMSETDEEVIVGKRAHVIEEVVLSKDVEERTETVRDTVRRTDVEVEGDADGGARGGYVFDDDRDHYRTHHRDTFTDTGYGYDDYEPAYRYGTALASHPDYRDREWSEVSPQAREHWERQNGETWADFEPAARYGYERAFAHRRRS